MKILQLGNASAIPPQGHYNASYLIDAAGRTILIDTPPSIITQLNNAHIKPEQIDSIVITHQHGDHLLGLPMLLVHGYAFYPDKIWHIITQDFLIDKIRQLIEIAYPELLHKRPFFDDNIRFHPITDPTNFTLQLTPNVTMHTAPTLHGVPGTAVRIDTNTASITYSADTGYSDQIAALARNTTLLIHEAGLGPVDSPDAPSNHSTAHQAGTAARNANAGALWLTHLDTLSDTHKTASIQAAENAFNGTVDIVDDFTWIPI